MKHKHQQPTRKDSVIAGVMDQYQDFKQMPVGNRKWPKVDKLINKDTTKLILFEVPKGVSIIQYYLITIHV